MQELLGEGTFAKVFKAALRQEKPTSPVSGLAINNWCTVDIRDEQLTSFAY